MTRAVVDPNVLVAAILNPAGTPAQCVQAFADGRFEAIVSPALLEELAAVLERDKFRRYESLERCRDYVTALELEGTMVEDPAAPRVGPDPGDDYLIALARTASAHVLVSGDAHLLELGLADVLVLSPRAFLDRLPN